MHRIDGAGHIAGMFVPEDPAINRPPTEITPEWLNTFQEELAIFVEWSGLVLDKGDNSQLKQALLAMFAPLSAIGSYRGTAVVAGNVTLDANYVGKVVRNNGANTLTLPLASSATLGACITISNQNGGVACTVQRNGAEAIEQNGAGITTFQLGFGETVVLCANAAGWTILSGANQASLNAAGYQRLPGGLIVQWGAILATANPSIATLPIAFPTAALHAVGNFRDLSSARIATVWAYSTTQVRAAGFTTAGAVVTSGEVISYVAIGY